MEVSVQIFFSFVHHMLSDRNLAVECDALLASCYAVSFSIKPMSSLDISLSISTRISMRSWSVSLEPIQRKAGSASR